MSPNHAMAGSIAESIGEPMDDAEGLPNEEEFQEARDGASQPPEGSVDREFPDATPLDPPYFESQRDTRSVMFGLSAEVAQYLDQGSGSDPPEGPVAGAPGLAPRAQLRETAARAESGTGLAPGGATAPLLDGTSGEGLGHWKEDSEHRPFLLRRYLLWAAPRQGLAYGMRARHWTFRWQRRCSSSSSSRCRPCLSRS